MGVRPPLVPLKGVADQPLLWSELFRYNPNNSLLSDEVGFKPFEWTR